jgi:hypothetical protein
MAAWVAPDWAWRSLDIQSAMGKDLAHQFRHGRQATAKTAGFADTGKVVPDRFPLAAVLPALEVAA